LFGIRTDLAIEAHEMVKTHKQQEIPGVEVDVDESKNMKITRVKITTDEGAKALGKPRGNYITIEAKKLRKNDVKVREEVSKNFAREIKNTVDLKPNTSVLVVGLGNWNVTPDALGPRVVHNVMVTRHLVDYVPRQLEEEGVRPISALSPGVMGLTGLETGEIIKGVVNETKPDVVFAIDALAARRMERVCTTIQLADTGIHPGSGVGSRRMGLTQQTLGVPVIAIGVPTVVDAATMANDAIDLMIDTMSRQAQKGSEFYKMIRNVDKREKYMLIKEVISPFIDNLMVTPKEIDELIKNLAVVIAGALNIALHSGVTYDDVTRYIQ